MRILYKTLASVGMLALSTAAAIGIRRLVKRKNEKEKAAHDEVKETNDDALKEQTTDNANSGDETVNNGEKIDDAETEENEVTVAETPIHPMTEDTKVDDKNIIDDSNTDDENKIDDSNTDDENKIDDSNVEDETENDEKADD